MWYIYVDRVGDVVEVDGVGGDDGGCVADCGSGVADACSYP